MTTPFARFPLLKPSLGPGLHDAVKSIGPTSCYALLKVGGEVVDDELDALSQTCAFLSLAGLKTAVVHGGGPQMNKELAKRGIQPHYVRGNRVTDQATLDTAVSVFSELNQRVVKAIAAAGVPAQGFASGVFRAKVASPELGLVGEVTGVEKSAVASALAANKVPVLTSLGFSSTHPFLNINADVAARELALALQPRRVVYTSAKGGWIDDDSKQIVPLINLKRDYARLAALNYEGRQGTLLKLNEIKALLDGLPGDAAVTIANASGILTELFSNQASTGSTFIKQEAKVTRFDSIGAVDLGRLAACAPGLDMTSSGLAKLQSTQAVVYCDASYTGCAVVQNKELVFFSAPPRSAVKAGLWAALEAHHPTLAWVVDQSRDADKAEQQVHVSGRQMGWYGPDWSVAQARQALASGKLAAAPDARASQWKSPRDAPSSSGKAPARKRVALLGARGYVGRELVKLIAPHPHLELALCSSRALAGKSVKAEFKVDSLPDSLRFETVEGSDVEAHPLSRQIDVWVLALPNGLAPKWVQPLSAVGTGANQGSGALLIDLGADFRFDPAWTYGLPERKGARALLAKTRRIANPGCYATAAQVSLMPLVAAGLLDPHVAPSVFGVSGYSGAGTNPSDKNDPVVLRDNIIPYSLVNHMHERECTKHLNTQIAFMPHVAPYFQGIAATTSAKLNKPTSEKEVLALFQDYFANERLIRVSAKAPLVRDNMTQHFCAVGGFAFDPKTNRLAMHATIDNLLKGAATQAMQNINIALGFPEYTCIES